MGWTSLKVAACRAANGPFFSNPALIRAEPLRKWYPKVQTRPVEGQEWEDLVGHLTRISPLVPAAATRVIAEVVAYFSESAEGFIRRRHRELHAAGQANPEIFARIAAELTARPVAAPALSERQIRRVIYG